MAAQYAFVMKDMTKSFPGAQKPVLSNINLQFYQGAKIGIVGPNGAGKTSLIAQISGVLAPDSGNISFLGQKITTWPIWRRSQAGIARSFQIASIFPEFTVSENVTLSIQAHKGHSFHFFKNTQYENQLAAAAQAILGQVGLGKKKLTSMLHKFLLQLLLRPSQN